MEKIKNRRVKILAFLGLLFVLLGTTYALFSYFNTGNNEISIYSNGISFNYKEGQKALNLENAIPIPDEQGKIQNDYFEFNIKAQSVDKVEIPYYITLRKTSSSSDIDDAIKLYLTSVDKNGNESEVKIIKYSELSRYNNSGIDLSKYTEKLLYNGKVLEHTNNYNKKYRLRMWIDLDTNFNEEKYKNATFSIKVNVYANSKNPNIFVSGNGSLHIEGSKLMNSKNEEFRLMGFSSATSTRISQNWATWYTDETFESIKNWGANFFRVTLKPEQYVENKELASQLFTYIDRASENDLYVLITWMGNSDFLNYKEEAKEFFELMSSRYKDNTNIMYEICNEPFNNKWDSIKNYAEEIIPVIRNNDSDAIIVVPVSYHIADTDDYMRTLLDNPITEDNIMYSAHMYVGNSLNSTTLMDIDKIINNNKAVIISEWGTTASDGSTSFYKDNSDIWLDFLNYRNISWLNFNLSDVYWNNTPYYSSVVKMGEWNSNLNDDILSESGKYIKNYLKTGNIELSKSLLMSRYDDYAFWNSDIANTITSITFKLNDYKPTTITQEWDVSMDNGVEKVKAYLSGTNLYIVSKDNKLYAPSNLKNFFKEFSELKSVDLTNLNLDDVTTIERMFYNNTKLTTITFGTQNTSKLVNMSQAFGVCKALTELDLSNMNLSNVENINLSFSWTNKLTTIKLPLLSESKITAHTETFYKTSNQSNNLTIYAKSENVDFINELIQSSTNTITTKNIIEY